MEAIRLIQGGSKIKAGAMGLYGIQEKKKMPRQVTRIFFRRVKSIPVFITFVINLRQYGQ